MAETRANDIPVFERGDTVRLTLHVQDESGVKFVEARFRNESDRHAKGIHQSLELEGDTDAFVIIEFVVGEDLPPGDYACEYIALTDGAGNKSLYAAPGIEFRVEGDDDERREGPALLDWSFA